MLRVISLPVDDGGCGNYRIRQPLELLKTLKGVETHVINKEKDNMIDIVRALAAADVVTLRPGAESGIAMIKQNVLDYKAETGDNSPMHAKWVLDIDDNVELISPYSLHYENYGIEEVKHNGKWLWKNGESNFNISENRKAVANHIEGMRNVDLVTTTTEKLAEYARQYNDNVAVLPNSVNTDRWYPIDLKPNKQLRVGWGGGVSHYEDWFSIKEPLNELMREFKFKLIMQGTAFPGILDDDNKHLLEAEEWVPFKGHPYMVKSLGIDIALVPLIDLPFNHYKSSIKWYEFSSLGIPSVVSNILPYSKDINKKNAKGYNTPKEFYTALRELLMKPKARQRIGLQAKKYVEENRDAKKNVILWKEVYESLNSTRKRSSKSSK